MFIIIYKNKTCVQLNCCKTNFDSIRFFDNQANIKVNLSKVRLYEQKIKNEKKLTVERNFINLRKTFILHLRFFIISDLVIDILLYTKKE